MAKSKKPQIPAAKFKIPKSTVVKTTLLAIAGGLAFYAIGDFAFNWNWAYVKIDSATKSHSEAQYFQPPLDSAIPNDATGDAIRRGQQIFKNTSTNASQFVGNGLSCANCHLDGGRRENAAPMWAAWVAYPKYRSKNKQINTMEDRLRGCFTYSMNAQNSPTGGPPPKGDDVYADLETFMYWMASDAPTGQDMKGSGFPTLKKTALGYDPQRGAKIFESNCAFCHSSNGQGRKDINGRYVFPPLWGPSSYNWGAGMASVKTAAAFIRANMPLGQSNRLSEQEAWDVAAFINSQERPKDPRQKASVAEAANAFYAGSETYYGKTVNGHLLGTGSPQQPSQP